jgi:hypothetical protein
MHIPPRLCSPYELLELSLRLHIDIVFDDPPDDPNRRLSVLQLQNAHRYDCSHMLQHGRMHQVCCECDSRCHIPTESLRRFLAIGYAANVYNSYISVGK